MTSRFFCALQPDHQTGTNNTGELASKKFMSWGREKQNAISKYLVAISNRSQRAA